MILALHSSPHPEGNLERMVNAVAQASRLEYEIIRFKSDTPPCFSCGLGPDCPVGMPVLHWPKGEFQAFTSVNKKNVPAL